MARKSMNLISNKIIYLISILAILGLPACSASSSKLPLDTYFPKANTVSTWMLAGEFQSYNIQNLFDYVDGQAESFFAYNFMQVGVQRYQDAQGNILTVELWQFASSKDAYGVFTINRVGTPVDIGNEGDGDPGQRLIFWQNNYYVRIRTNQALPQATLVTFAKSVSAKLPQGGSRPGVVLKLPQPGLQPLSVIYFHQETSIQSEIWLGGNNILGLKLDTDASLGEYSFNGQSVYLMLVNYSSGDAATSSCKALRSNAVDSFIYCDQFNGLLGATFGSIDQATAMQLVKQALEG
jgi:hypothetical protein